MVWFAVESLALSLMAGMEQSSESIELIKN